MGLLPCWLTNKSSSFYRFQQQAPLVSRYVIRLPSKITIQNSVLKMHLSIDFSDDNVNALSRLTVALGDTLIKAGFGMHVDTLTQIRLAAERREQDIFVKQVTSRELFGGSGAIWELWISDPDLQLTFERQFCEFVDHLKKMGIDNSRINQVRQDFNL